MDTQRAETERYLRMAMEEAETAARDGNQPYGAVIVDPDGTVVATGRNRTAEEHDPSSHAEMNAIRHVCRERETLSLEGYRLYTNGAPCSMCATAIVRSGLSEVFYAAPPDPDRTLPTLEELIERSGATAPVVNQGILADEASAQLARWAGKAGRGLIDGPAVASDRDVHQGTTRLRVPYLTDVAPYTPRKSVIP